MDLDWTNNSLCGMSCCASRCKLLQLNRKWAAANRWSLSAELITTEEPRKAPEGASGSSLKEAGKDNDVFFQWSSRRTLNTEENFLVVLGACVFALDFKPTLQLTNSRHGCYQGPHYSLWGLLPHSSCYYAQKIQYINKLPSTDRLQLICNFQVNYFFTKSCFSDATECA